MNVPVVGTTTGPINYSPRETFFTTLFGGGEVDSDFQKIPYHSAKNGGLGITDPWISE